jgi:AcrR family transcriptional regulator
MVKSRKTAPAKEQEIIAAAASLFKKKGYRATTLEDIAAAVGMLKGSLYYYIRSKEELLYLVVRDPIRQAYHKLEEIVNSAAPVTDKITQAIANHIAVFDQHYPHIAVYLHDFHNMMEKLQDNSTEAPKEYQQLLAQLLQQGVDNGELRSDLDVAVAGYAILGMCNWMYRWYKPGGHMSAEAVANVFTKLVLEGLQKSV